MAERIVGHGFALDVWARRPEVAEPFAALGADVTTSPCVLAERCDVVGICVGDDAAVEDVVFGQRLLESMQPGSVLVIHSTVSPQLCRRIAAAAEPLGVDVLDAPVSGGHSGAQQGTLAVMVGGPEGAFERIRPVLETFGNPIRHVGGVGDAQALKLVNNGLFVANIAVAAAAMSLAEHLGLRPDTVREVVAASSGRSGGFEALPFLADPEMGRHPWSVLRKDVGLLRGVEAGLEGGATLSDVAQQAIDRFTSTEGEIK